MKKLFFLSLLLLTPQAQTQSPETNMDDLLKELNALSETAAKKPVIATKKTVKPVLVEKVQQPKINLLEKELTAFLDKEIAPISDDLAKIVKGKQFSELVKTKQKKKADQESKAKGREKKDHGKGHGSSSPWSSRAPDYEKPYRAPSSSKDSGYWGGGYDTSSQQSGYTPQSTTASGPNDTSIKTPTDSTTGLPGKSGTSEADNKKEKEDEHKPTYMNTAEDDEATKALKTRIADLTSRINEDIKQFISEKDPAKIEKAYDNQASQWSSTRARFDGLLKSAEQINTDINKIGIEKKDKTQPDRSKAREALTASLRTSLTALLPHALEISSRLQPDEKTKEAKSLDEARALLVKFSDYGINPTETVKALAKEQALKAVAPQPDEAGRKKVARLQTLLSFASGLSDDDKKEATTVVESYKTAVTNKITQTEKDKTAATSGSPEATKLETELEGLRKLTLP